MALKADRYEESTDISFFYNAGTATRGGVVCLADLGLASGAALDQGENLVSYQQTTGSEVPVGILLNDVVNKDLTRTHLNQYKDEVQKGGKVTVLTRGWVVTNNVTGTPTAGAVAYADGVTAGNVTAGAVHPTVSGAPIGRWMSRKDADGYAKLYVNLPNFA
tara:strand:+ start:85 stop:570 length:486 start_codon:yes stop_codon:yes gene_type:complete